MRLRRVYADFYLLRGNNRRPLREPLDLPPEDRRRIEKLSYSDEWECIKVLDPATQDIGHYAVNGRWWRFPADEAFNEYGDLVYDTEMCETYAVALVVQRGRWFTAAEWEAQLPPDMGLARVSLRRPSNLSDLPS